ncbi:hypothetical protein V5O48_007453 [Marasmius crinis-equi]|uniref:Reverse transcriptase n=1 Tax=Marasmius crinis-equi TaxID=585013 RepID=A0ABR3FH34_9AGAR
MAVDNRPIALGLITQEVVSNVRVGSHNETIALNVVSVGYPIILGLDWLRRHNPRIDWQANTLSLECCGLSRASPSTVFAKGYGLSTHASLNTTSVGLGFGLTSSPFTSLRAFTTEQSSQPQESSQTPDLDDIVPSPSSPIPDYPSRPRTSFLAAFIHHSGYGNSLRSSPFKSPVDSVPPE